MLRKYSKTRTLSDNIKLGTITAFSGGMINVASFMIFLSFSSNVTGYYAIFATEIVRGNFYQVVVVLGWIMLFLLGGFIANLIVIHFNTKNKHVAHATPIALEIICLLIVGVYGQFFYDETLSETESLLSLMLFAMGLQNGLTASVSNFAVKTTHLTGATTDLGLLLSMFTKKELREKQEVRDRARLTFSIICSYMLGTVAAGLLYSYVQFTLFYIVSLFLFVVIVYDFFAMRLLRWIVLLRKKRSVVTDSPLPAPKKKFAVET
jgi:uncharacterized membrane protein YoaK (UPF0700 family)